MVFATLGLLGAFRAEQGLLTYCAGLSGPASLYSCGAHHKDAAFDLLDARL